MSEKDYDTELQRAASEWVKARCDEDDDPIFWKGEMRVAFMAGAKWQKKQTAGSTPDPAKLEE